MCVRPSWLNSTVVRLKVMGSLLVRPHRLPSFNIRVGINCACFKSKIVEEEEEGQRSEEMNDCGTDAVDAVQYDIGASYIDIPTEGGGGGGGETSVWDIYK